MVRWMILKAESRKQLIIEIAAYEGQEWILHPESFNYTGQGGFYTVMMSQDEWMNEWMNKSVNLLYKPEPTLLFISNMYGERIIFRNVI